MYASRPGDVFEERGREQWHLVKSLLGPDADLSGKRIFDFGCGAGRILRTAVVEDPEAEFSGCDIHGPSIEWLRQHLSPRARFFQAEAWPPTPHEDRHFDLIYAFSVPG
ncbi:MAG TPA: class I SAM-dependent methyltransferase [Solirubrobacteraceae bacterium]|nr:class I SAM-dependent methyltransferase [Solirubrobacteraceae bacterium]